MTLITRNIGRLPVNLGDYDSSRAYGRKNRCLQYGCEVESLVENNTDAPFTWDGDKTFTLSANWRLISGNPEVWAAGNPKPASTGTTGDYPYNGMGRVVIPKNMVNIAEQGEPENIVNLLTQDAFEDGDGNPLTNTVFVIQYDFVLGEDITIPANCVLEFEGGSLSNGTVDFNNSKIKSPIVKIFNNVIIENCGNDVFYAPWAITENFEYDYLPKDIKIDFCGKTYTSSVPIRKSDNVNWKNFHLITKGLWFETGGFMANGTCSTNGYGNSIVSEETINNPEDLIGCIITITTSTKVPYDDRPNDGIPTLWKGMTSKITNIVGNTIYLEDYIESFPLSTDYTKESTGTVETIYSRYLVSKPISVNIEDCIFETTGNEPGGIANGIVIEQANDIYIGNTEIYPNEDYTGSAVLLTLGQCVNGLIEKSVVKNAAYEGTATSYGIQINGSTRIVISDCTFEYNRRAVDFSGNPETRYCVVRDCKVVGKSTYSFSGSAFGSHSPSFGNMFVNNFIGADCAVGIQLRGSQEIADGNVFTGSYNSLFVAGMDSVIKNNVYQTGKFTTRPSIMVQLPSPDHYTTATIKNNVFNTRQKVVYRPSNYVRIALEGNQINFASNEDSLPCYVIDGDLLDTTIMGNSIKLISGASWEMCNGEVSLFGCSGHFDVPLTIGDRLEYGGNPLQNIEITYCRLEYDKIDKFAKARLFVKFNATSAINTDIAVFNTAKTYLNIGDISMGKGLTAYGTVIRGYRTYNGTTTEIKPCLSPSNRQIYMAYEGDYTSHFPEGSYEILVEFN